MQNKNENDTISTTTANSNKQQQAERARAREKDIKPSQNTKHQTPNTQTISYHIRYHTSSCRPSIPSGTTSTTPPLVLFLVFPSGEAVEDGHDGGGVVELCTLYLLSVRGVFSTLLSALLTLSTTIVSMVSMRFDT